MIKGQGNDHFQYKEACFHLKPKRMWSIYGTAMVELSKCSQIKTLILPMECFSSLVLTTEQYASLLFTGFEVSGASSSARNIIFIIFYYFLLFTWWIFVDHIHIKLQEANFECCYMNKLKIRYLYILNKLSYSSFRYHSEVMLLPSNTSSSEFELVGFFFLSL